MADLTTLEEKLAEVTGLAGAAHPVTVRDGSLELAAEEDPYS